MIVVRLIGGLGNQLFQYALGRTVALRHGTELKLDVWHFGEYKLHAYALSALQITAGIAYPPEMAGMPEVKEPYLHFVPEMLEVPDGTYLKGYWTTEKYFLPIRDHLLAEFQVRTPLQGRDLLVAERMRRTESVSLHIRRSDYVAGTYSDQILEPCPLDYYDRAVSALTRQVQNPEFFIFSDDPGWVREHLKLPYPMTMVDHNTAETNYEDLRLMSLCRHNIIANSTFSWWGAWLNRHAEKVVIGPSKWFTHRARNTDKDIVSDAWIRV